MKNTLFNCSLVAIFLLIFCLPVQARELFPSPPELWQRCQKELPGLDLTITKDEIVNSYSNPKLYD